jgi:hypothetical protein
MQAYRGLASRGAASEDSPTTIRMGVSTIEAYHGGQPPEAGWQTALLFFAGLMAIAALVVQCWIVERRGKV